MTGIELSGMTMFMGALAVAYLVPGPDMVLVLQTGAVRGRTAALLTAAGLALSRGAHVALAALGLAALLQAAPVLFEGVRLAGAAYLVWLGIAILRAPSLLPPDAGGAVAAPSAMAAVMRGLVTNLFNPKALLFCSVLLPQFIDTGAGNVPAQFTVLGLVLVALGAVFDVLYACAGGALGRWLARHPAALAAQRWIFALLLIGFAARLAWVG